VIEFLPLIGEQITVYCMNYIYTGVLVNVSDHTLTLHPVSIVYETGPHNAKEWKDAQALPEKWNIQISAIESWGQFK